MQLGSIKELNVAIFDKGKDFAPSLAGLLELHVNQVPLVVSELRKAMQAIEQLEELSVHAAFVGQFGVNFDNGRNVVSAIQTLYPKIYTIGMTDKNVPTNAHASVQYKHVASLASLLLESGKDHWNRNSWDMGDHQ